MKNLKQKTHVVVGTPGRLMDHIERGTIDLSEVRHLVLNEADEMLKMGFIDQVEDIIIIKQLIMVSFEFILMQVRSRK